MREFITPAAVNPYYKQFLANLEQSLGDLICEIMIRLFRQLLIAAFYFLDSLVKQENSKIPPPPPLSPQT